MIHEGAKAAAYCDALVNDPERKRELRAHPLGRGAGLVRALGRPGRCARHLSQRHSMSCGEANFGASVIYVCDNDSHGVAAAPTFSKCYWPGDGHDQVRRRVQRGLGPRR